ncbi:MAG: 4-(cytidine 5'-diphospho)-2-C-methyl-D-erythritol kinase [Spirochaetaceae bacterium]|jgi:4-diphosphocytidyl-2-C-methyl-D-erythritol kinase|nr:4-(cytidine 5'-diphospho)-2-C-methyl-D-erythritol kinase [Spirochaetaceae bacterium]
MMIIEAPAKINLHLSVGAKRRDGYHDIASILCTVAWGDTLTFAYADKDSVHFLPTGRLDPQENTVYQTLKLFKRRTGFTRGIQASVTKRIPVGAGLGGGSSDAAATLKALDMMAGTKLPSALLHSMAEDLGSDVPFFLEGGSAWVTGRGEKIAPLTAPNCDLGVTLLFPGFQSPTAEAFRFLDKVRTHTPAALPPSVLLQAMNAPPSSWSYSNDFLEYSPYSALYKRLLQHLLQYGADFVGLSGSGSTCFGIFMDQQRAQEVPEYGCGALTLGTRILRRQSHEAVKATL